MTYYLKDVPKSIRDKWIPYIEKTIGYFSFLTKRKPPKYIIIHKNDLNAQYIKSRDIIIIDDKLLASFTRPEVKFCIGHEMGHREMYFNSNHKEHIKDLDTLNKQWVRKIHHKFKSISIVSDIIVSVLLILYLAIVFTLYIRKPSILLLADCIGFTIFVSILIPTLIKLFHKTTTGDEMTTIKHSCSPNIAKVMRSEEYNADKIGVLLTNDKNNAIKAMKILKKRDEKIYPKKNLFFKLIDKIIYIKEPSLHPNADERIKRIENIKLNN